MEGIQGQCSDQGKKSNVNVCIPGKQTNRLLKWENWLTLGNAGWVGNEERKRGLAMGYDCTRKGGRGALIYYTLTINSSVFDFRYRKGGGGKE